MTVQSDVRRGQIRAAVARWTATHRDEALARATVTRANRRAAAAGVLGRIHISDVLDLWSRQPSCVNCGRGRGLDHVIALARGGTNVASNLQNLCPDCNARKGTKDQVPS